MPSAVRGRRWCFTLNNPYDGESNRLVLEWPETVVYSLYQLEKGKEGTPHYQGYVCMSTQTTLAAMRNIIPKAHWEVCKGSHTQNKVYCTKAETRVDGPWEHGKEPSQGERVDLVALKETMDSGASMKQIVQEHPAAFLRYGRSIREYRQIMQPERDWKTYVEFHWGVTGCGKSHYAKTTYPGAYRKASSKWWDGYDSHEVVIMDEFYGLHFDPSYMLQLMDQYGFQV